MPFSHVTSWTKKGSLAVYQVLEQQRAKAAALFHAELAGVPRFVFPWEQEACPRCGSPLEVRLTRRRTVHSIRYGTFQAVERQGRCRQHRELPPARSEALARLVAPGSNHAYDALVRVGMARFLECRQDEQIREEICRQHGIELGRSTVSYLARKFAAYVQVVHQQSVPALRGAVTFCTSTARARRPAGCCWCAWTR